MTGLFRIGHTEEGMRSIPSPLQPMDDAELTVTEAAARKGVHRTAVLKAIRENRLPARWELLPAAKTKWIVPRPAAETPRGRWLIRVEALDEWVVADQAEKGRRGGRPHRRDG